MPRASRRSTASTAAAATASPVRRNRSRKSAKAEPETHDDMDVDEDNDDDDDADHDDANGEDDDDDHHAAGPSRRRSKPRASTTSRRRVKTEEDATDGDDEPASTRRRSIKQVSYKEIPMDVEDPVDDDDDDDEGAEEEDDEDEPEPVTPAPRKTRTRTKNTTKDADDKPYKREPGTGGRGGFSVKGAAAAAARARWDKVRRERAERGEDSDDTPRSRRRRSPPPPKRDPRGALENVVAGQIYKVKGVEYTAGDDELILPENPKGEAKVDAEGRLQGGREYKLVTFTSATRKNPERLYALTIDAARACGYTDSLAFLRRCPQVVKLSCDQDERQMLIDVGRITGNLKHRMVTMVAVRNVYKLMGARLVKDGKWVDDDYNEEQALADCTANGYTPHGPVLEEELAVNQYPSAGGPGRPTATATSLADTRADKSMLASFYTVGGPTTHFGSNGLDPWNDVAHGKRGRLRLLGVTEEDWMLRTAEEARRIDETLRKYREERIGALEGPDAHGWVYTAERRAAGEIEDNFQQEGTLPPRSEAESTPAIKPHPLAREVTFEPPSSEPLSPAPPEPTPTPAPGAVFTGLAEAEAESEEPKMTGGTIVVETEAETIHSRPGVGSWAPGVIRAAYEPHTQMPHVPITTQPSTAGRERLSYNPLVGLNGSARITPAPGIASVEFVFEPSKEKSTWLSFGEGSRGPEVAQDRRQAIADAEVWAKQAREKRRRMKALREQEQRERELAAARDREPTHDATREATAVA